MKQLKKQSGEKNFFEKYSAEKPQIGNHLQLSSLVIWSPLLHDDMKPMTKLNKLKEKIDTSM